MIWDFIKYSNKIAIIQDNQQQLSYGEIFSLIVNLSKVIPQRSLVFCLCQNSIGSLIGYISFIKNHVVPLLLDEHIDKTLLEKFILLYSPQFLWLPTERKHEFSGHVIYSLYGYSLLKLNNSKKHEINSKLALLITTSGSTGSPKLVRQSYNNIEANTKSIVEFLALDSTERVITTLPMNYTYGLSIINTHLAVGATILLTNKTIIQREFWNFFTEQKATSFGGVPYTYEMLDKLLFFRRKLPYLRTMTQAGGKISFSLHRKFAEYAQKEHKRFIVMYGQAEATARMAYLPPEKSLEKCGAAGIAIPGGNFKLFGDDGSEVVGPNETGELVYFGPNVSMGYALTSLDLAKGDEFNGVLKTGDLAKFDEDGFIYIVGRKKRFLKIFGNRIGLDETELLIKNKFPSIKCACSGKDDAMYVFINDKKNILEVKKFLSEKTHLNQSAFHIKFIDRIPVNESGKILYRKLEQFYD